MEKLIGSKRSEKSRLVDPRNARAEGYKQIIEDIITKNECPLCPPMKWHPNPILHDNDLWLITRNSHPYPNSSYHFLLVCKEHIETLEEVTPQHSEAFFDLAKWATKEFHIVGGGLAMRFGDTLYTGATVTHLHGHFIVPTVDGGKVLPVYFPIG